MSCSEHAELHTPQYIRALILGAGALSRAKRDHTTPAWSMTACQEVQICAFRPDFINLGNAVEQSNMKLDVQY